MSILGHADYIRVERELALSTIGGVLQGAPTSLLTLRCLAGRTLQLSEEIILVPVD